jgi:hypothetical protein
MLSRPARLLVLLALTGIGRAAGAQLPAQSPFASPESAPVAPKPEQMLEFDGFATTSAGIAYVVHDKARKARAWLTLNRRDKDLGLLAKSYDPQQETLTVEQAGVVQTLPMRRARILSAGAPPVVRPLSFAPPVSAPPVVNPAQLPPATATATSARALEQVVADVQARRAAREQAAIQAAGAPAPTTVNRSTTAR